MSFFLFVYFDFHGPHSIPFEQTFNVLNGTPAFQCGYRLNADTTDEDILDKWEDKFMTKLSEITDDLGIDKQVSISYNADKSFNDELTRAVASDVISFAFAFTVLGLFATLLVMRFKRRTVGTKGCCKWQVDNKRSRSLLASFGIWSSLLATGAAFGIVGGIIGIKFNSVVSISPFLLVGLGGMCEFVYTRY